MKQPYEVAVIGLGYVGLVLAGVLASRGCQVIGVDTNRRIVDAANMGKAPFYEPGLDALLAKAVETASFRATTDIEAAKNSSIKLVTVGTPLGNDLKPDLSSISAVAVSLAGAIKSGDIVLLKSTVTPGVTEEVFGKLLAKASGLKAGVDFELVFSPERLAEGRAVEEFATLPIVVGSSSPLAEHQVATFWKETLGVEVITMGSAVAAELVKLANNLWIDVNISLANLIALVAHSFDIAPDEIIRAANTLPKGDGYVNILQSSIGVGGSCLTKDPLFFASLVDHAGGDSRVILGARAVNESMPRVVAAWIDDWLDRLQLRESPKLKLALLGVAFKDNTSDLRYSPMIKLYRELIATYTSITVFDPYIQKSALVEAFCGAEICESLEAALDDATVAVFGCNHAAFSSVDLVGLINRHVKHPGLVVDGRKALRHRLRHCGEQLHDNIEFRSI